MSGYDTQRKKSDTGSAEPENDQSVCFRPFPCHTCRQGITTLGFLRDRLEANPVWTDTSFEDQCKIQVEYLREWAGNCTHNAEVRIVAPRVDEGSEHYVHLDTKDADLYKITKPGIYGDYYFLKDEMVHQAQCTPIQYLVRLRLWKKLFGSAPIPLGITRIGQIVSLHKFILGSVPSQEETDDYLSSIKLEPVKKECFFWKCNQGTGERTIGIGDTRDENFIKSPNGIVPIDIRLWLMDE